jgi:hypothetical protein
MFVRKIHLDFPRNVSIVYLPQSGVAIINLLGWRVKLPDLFRTFHLVSGLHDIFFLFGRNLHWRRDFLLLRFSLGLCGVVFAFFVNFNVHVVESVKLNSLGLVQSLLVLFDLVGEFAVSISVGQDAEGCPGKRFFHGVPLLFNATAKVYVDAVDISVSLDDQGVANDV